MFTLENILNQEAWCALALAILSPRFMIPDQACMVLAKGKYNRFVHLKLRGENMKDSPCYGCNVGFYCDYDPRWCRDSAVKEIGQDEMYEPSDCQNWRCCGREVADKNKVA